MIYPEIAACSGGFQVAGVLAELAVECGNTGGDDGGNPSGIGCSAADLCAPGWHVCISAAEVALRSPTGCNGAAPEEGLFFLTRQGGPGCGLCATGNIVSPECDGCQCVQGCVQSEFTANDVFGCGSMGDTPSDCGVLDRFSNDQCGALGPPWMCPGDSCGEAHNVAKPSSQGGGALCCHDQLD